jgi:hypothetical protein
LIAAALALIPATGCSLLPDPELAIYRRALVLELIGAKSTAAGSVVVDLKLSHRGDRTIDACIGPSRSLSARSAGGSASSLEFTHHAGCVRNFRLAPGGELVWPETFERFSKTSTDAKLEVSIEILNPRRCGATGCSRTTLTAARD